MGLGASGGHGGGSSFRRNWGIRHLAAQKGRSDKEESKEGKEWLEDGSRGAGRLAAFAAYEVAFSGSRETGVYRLRPCEQSF